MNRVSDRDTRLTGKLWTEWFRRSRFNLSTSDHPAKGKADRRSLTELHLKECSSVCCFQALTAKWEMYLAQVLSKPEIGSLSRPYIVKGEGYRGM